MQPQHKMPVILLALILISGCKGQTVGLPELLQPGTAVPTATPTTIPSPTPIPTPTPLPVQVIGQGERDLRNGNWDAAMLAFQQVITDPGATPLEQAAAQVGLAQASLERGDFGSAKAILDTFIATYSTDEKIAQAYFLRGEAKLGLSDWSGAIEDYNTYLSMRPGLIDSYVYERIADAHIALNQSDQALVAYDQALAADRDFVGNLQLREKVATIQRSLGNYDAAVEQYQTILSVAQNPGYRASIDFYIAQTLLEAGRMDEGYEQLDFVFMTYPESFEALSSLRALIEAEITVDQYQRGLVNYYQGQYDIAIEAFYNYLAGTSINYPPDAHLYIARSYRQIGNPQAALTELQALLGRFDLDDGPDVWANAWLELADTYAEIGDTEAAFTTYDQFVVENPTLAQASDALFDAALLSESLGDTTRAIAYYQRLASEYPGDSRAADALFRAGLDAYRAGDYTAAATLFTSTTTMSANEQSARSYFWLGKTYLAGGQTEQANTAFTSAVAAEADGYYGLRAQDMLDGQQPFALEGELALPTVSNQGREEAEQWVVTTFGLAEVPPLANTLRADLATDPRMLRARELWDLGLQLEARTLFEDVRAAYWEDPLATYQLAIYFRDIGLFRSSVLAASRVLVLADASPLTAPQFLVRLRNPLYFSDLVLEGAEMYQLDPLWVYALIWQESTFEGFAVSTASAQGLMQIWPPTGEDIAGRLQWPNYQPSDLQRPYVSVAFGTWLLREELNRFDDNQYAALSAYNAGPGNTATWVERSGGDLDLFVESISLSEPKLYVQRVYQHYEIYRLLYSTPPG
jgi:soluble lytic murein transglycosylase